MLQSTPRLRTSLQCRLVMCRHIFEGQKAYVEEYFAKDVASELGLSQTKLIRLAMLLGSDYTEGINGIGGGV